MSDVFLSYSRKDTAFVREIFELLSARKREAWIDLHDIDYSSKWWEEICCGIDGADNFVLFVSQNSLESMFCHREIQYALEHNKRIIPFLIKQVDQKAMFQAWQSNPSFKNYEQLARQNWESIQAIQWLDFAQLNDMNQAVDALLETVDTDPERARYHTRLLLRLREWESRGRNPSGLLRGEELAQYEQWLVESRQKQTPPHPTDEQAAYIAESCRVQEELEAKRIQRESLIRRFRGASIALGVFFTLAVVATFLSIAREGRTKAQVAAGNTQIAVIGKTLTPIPPQLTAVAQTVVAGSYMIESLNLSGEANSILRADAGNAETAALLSIRVLRKIYLPSADAALVDASRRLRAAPLVFTYQGQVSSVAFSPDGKTFLSGVSGSPGTNTDTLELRDTLGEKVIWTQTPQSKGIFSAAFSPDGRLVVVAAGNHTAMILDAASGKLLRILEGHGDVVQRAVFSPDGETLLTLGGGSDRSVRLWTVETGQQIFSTPAGIGFTSLFFYPNGQSFYAADNLYDASDGHLLDGPVGGGVLAISPDGKTCVTGIDSTAELYSTSTGQELRKFSGHTDSIVSAAFSADGKWLITGSIDHTARVWEISSGKQILLLSGNSDSVNSVAFSPDRTRVLTGSDSARLWNITTVNQQLTFSAPAGITISALSADGSMLLVGDENGNTGLWDLNTGKMLRNFPKQNQDVKSIALSPDDKLVAIPIRSDSDPNSVSVNLYDAATGTLLKTFSTNPRIPLFGTLTFSADGKMLFAMDFDNNSRLWDVETGQVLRQFNGNDPSYNSASVFSTGGNLVVLGGGTSWWDVSTGEQLNFPIAMNGSVMSFSADGSLAAMANNGKNVMVWNVSTQQLVNTFSGHTDRVVSLAFSPDNKLLLSGSADKTARLWDISTGRLLRVFSGHTAAVTSVVFTPDGKKIITTSLDKTVRTWITDYNDLLAYACTLVGRDLTPEERELYGVSGDDPTCPQFGEQAQPLMPTTMPISTSTPLSFWTPIATPTQGNAAP